MTTQTDQHDDPRRAEVPVFPLVRDLAAVYAAAVRRYETLVCRHSDAATRQREPALVEHADHLEQVFLPVLEEDLVAAGAHVDEHARVGRRTIHGPDGSTLATY